MATSLRIKPEIKQMLEALSSHTRLNRTQVIEQALLRMSRQEGLVLAPAPIELNNTKLIDRPTEGADSIATAGNEAFARIWDTPEEDAAWAHLQEEM
jgi:hypothetical protein